MNASHGRDYVVLIEDCLSSNQGQHEIAFTHCVRVDCETRVRDDVWSKSWTDYERWKAMANRVKNWTLCKKKWFADFIFHSDISVHDLVGQKGRSPKRKNLRINLELSGSRATTIFGRGRLVPEVQEKGARVDPICPPPEPGDPHSKVPRSTPPPLPENLLLRLHKKLPSGPLRAQLASPTLLGDVVGQKRPEPTQGYARKVPPGLETHERI